LKINKGVLKENTYYFVGAVLKQHPVDLGNLGEQDLPLIWADGMIGVMPVFDNYQDAKKYARNDFQIIQIKAETI